MEERRGLENRVARLEERTARLDERMGAEVSSREQWRGETARRLSDLNHAREELRTNIERDRESFVSKEVYESRHREVTTSLAAAADKLEQRIVSHERDDMASHLETARRLEQSDKETAQRVKVVEDWMANMNGRFWALGVGLGLLLSLLTIFLHLFWK